MTLNQGNETSPQIYARTAGLLYLVIIVLGVFAEFFVRERLIVPGEATATGNNIIAHQLLFRFGFTADLIAILCDVPMEVIFYLLLRPVNKNMAMLVLFFALLGDGIMAVNELSHYAPFLILGNIKYLAVFNENQLHALVLLCFNFHTVGLLISMVFFGFHCLFFGCLIIRSAILPKMIGFFLIISCLCLLINSFAYFIAPDLNVPELILLPDFLTELSLCLWLIVKGVKVPKLK